MDAENRKNFKLLIRRVKKNATPPEESAEEVV
jgi:hypothetical protein